ncbi:hypothetical protein M378DRAFT_18210 [Amanita muscaria Koide BX008]|uniref:Uncharacterized protein n=1 Tax=Amanita muscaria (strain Koide BX008) TaxID=946122 RepID=A0A0C2WEY2_AMAMK|nr:hypothetical protein M378DRAFT_18210 [Amanita muscaria Koide BX008]
MTMLASDNAIQTRSSCKGSREDATMSPAVRWCSKRSLTIVQPAGLEEKRG